MMQSYAGGPVALMTRFASQDSNDYAARLFAPTRAGFGGHLVQRDDGDGKAKGGG